MQIEQLLSNHDDETATLGFSWSLELVLMLEFNWLILGQLLPPLTVARLMIGVFPSFPDAFLVANLV